MTAGIRLLDAIPEMQTAVPDADRQLASRTAVLPLIAIAPGKTWTPPTVPADPFAFVVVDGILQKHTTLLGRAAVELLGAGDVLLHGGADGDPSSAAASHHVAQVPTTVAVLDDRYRLAAGRWPALDHVLHQRIAGQVRRASVHLAIMQLPRVEDRILALFADFAERWGRVTPDGIAVDLPLTHDLLGRLAGSQRPTVTVALRGLRAEGQLSRTPSGWLVGRGRVASLAGDPASV